MTHVDRDEPTSEIGALRIVAFVGAALMLLGVLFWAATNRTMTASNEPVAVPSTVGEGTSDVPPSPPTKRPDL